MFAALYIRSYILYIHCESFLEGQPGLGISTPEIGEACVLLNGLYSTQHTLLEKKGTADGDVVLGRKMENEVDVIAGTT